MTTTEDPESLVNRIITELEARPEVKPALLRALLTDEFLLLPAKVDRLMELVPTVEKLQQDVSELEEGQARLEEGQARLEEGQARLEEGQARLTAGQQRMSGELSNLTGSQYQRHITEIGERLVRREIGVYSACRLHADLAFGERMTVQIGNDAAAEGRITDDEADELVLSDIIFVGVDETSQPVQALLEVSVTVQQHDIERAEARARILEKATGIRTIAGVVGESIPEQERTRAQGRGVVWVTVQSGQPPR